MKNTVLVVWVSWWIGQCLCNQYLPEPLKPTPRSHTWGPSPKHNSFGQRLPSSNNSLVGRGILIRESHLASGEIEGTHYNTENTSQTVVTMNKTDTVHYGTSGDKSKEDRISPSVPEPITRDNSREHKVSSVPPSITRGNSREHKVSSVPPSIIRDNSRDHRVSPSVPPSFTRHNSSEHRISPSVPSPITNTEDPGHNEGGRGDHGRVITGLKDLCSFCLCDSKKTNVYCKHEHTNHETIHELLLDHQVIPRSAETLHIAGFEKVHIKNNTFSREDLKLRKILFEDIAHLELQTHSLHFSARAEQNMEVGVIFTKCNISEMPQQTFTQLIRSEDPRQEINLEETRFLTLKFDGCNITAIRSYALYNARLLGFHMTRSKVKIMEENSVHLDSYDEWLIEKSQLPNMVEKSICLRAQGTVVVSHNTFLGLGSRSLDILASSPVLFEFNHISHLRSEALLGIRPHKDTRAANIVFLNNTIAKADERSLLISKLYEMHERKITDNKFNILCDCNVMMTFEKLLGITDTSDYTDLEMFKTVTQKSLCQVNANKKSYSRVKGYVAHKCTLPITAIVAGSTVVGLILLLVMVCVVCTRRVRKAREEANYLGECHFSQSFSTLPSNTQLPMSSITGHPGQSWEPTIPLQPWVMAVPEVKTYRETELNVAYERTEPMKVSLRDSYPHEPGPLLDLQRKTQIRSSCPFN